jgi:hypothetical protein
VEDLREAALFKVAVSLKKEEEQMPLDLSFGFPSIEKMLEELQIGEIRKRLSPTILSERMGFLLNAMAEHGCMASLSVSISM